MWKSLVSRLHPKATQKDTPPSANSDGNNYTTVTSVAPLDYGMSHSSYVTTPAMDCHSVVPIDYGPRSPQNRMARPQPSQLKSSMLLDVTGMLYLTLHTVRTKALPSSEAVEMPGSEPAPRHELSAEWSSSRGSTLYAATDNTTKAYPKLASVPQVVQPSLPQSPSFSQDNVLTYEGRVFCQRKTNTGTEVKEFPRDIAEFRPARIVLIPLIAGTQQFLSIDVVFGPLDKAAGALWEKHFLGEPWRRDRIACSCRLLLASKWVIGLRLTICVVCLVTPMTAVMPTSGITTTGPGVCQISPLHVAYSGAVSLLYLTFASTEEG